jgi:hypothetical protein
MKERILSRLWNRKGTMRTTKSICDRRKRLSVVALAATSLSLVAADYQYIISVPEGDVDPKVKSCSSGADIDTLSQTVEFSDGIDLVTTPFKGFYIHFR